MESDDEGNLPCILIFDSLPRRRVQNYVDDISLVRQYLTMEWISKAYPKIYVSTNNISFHTEHMQWDKVYKVLVDSPIQPNGFDCGLYTVKNCEWIMTHLETSTQTDIEQAFTSFSCVLDYTVDDILAHRLNMRVLIESLMSAYRSVRLSLNLPVSSIVNDFEDEGEDL